MNDFTDNMTRYRYFNPILIDFCNLSIHKLYSNDVNLQHFPNEL